MRLDRSSHLSQVRSAQLGFTTCDLKLRKSLLLRPNSVLGVLGLYGKPIELRIQPYIE